MGQVEGSNVSGLPSSRLGTTFIYVVAQDMMRLLHPLHIRPLRKLHGNLFPLPRLNCHDNFLKGYRYAICLLR